MTTINREQLFALFRDDEHPAIQQALDLETIQGLAVYEDTDGKRRALPANDTQQRHTTNEKRAFKGSRSQ